MIQLWLCLPPFFLPPLSSWWQRIKINIEKRCRSSQQTTVQVLGTAPSSDALDSCVRDEQAARPSKCEPEKWKTAKRTKAF